MNKEDKARAKRLRETAEHINPATIEARRYYEQIKWYDEDDEQSIGIAYSYLSPEARKIVDDHKEWKRERSGYEKRIKRANYD